MKDLTTSTQIVVRLNEECLTDGSKVFNLQLGSQVIPCADERHGYEAYALAKQLVQVAQGMATTEQPVTVEKVLEGHLYFPGEIEHAKRKGAAAVAEGRVFAPRNPYNKSTVPSLYTAWEEGAIEAGLNVKYVNGRLVE